MQIGVIHKPCGRKFGLFWPPPLSPLWTILLNKAYVVIWTLSKHPPPFHVPIVYGLTPLNLTRSRESGKRRLKPWIAPIHFLWSSTFLSKGDNAFCLLLNRVMMNFGSPHLLFEFLYEKNQYFILYDVTRLRLYGTHYPGLWGFLRSNCYIPPACGACWGIKNSILGNLFSHVSMVGAISTQMFSIFGK